MRWSNLRLAAASNEGGGRYDLPEGEALFHEEQPDPQAAAEIAEMLGISAPGADTPASEEAPAPEEPEVSDTDDLTEQVVESAPEGEPAVELDEVSQLRAQNEELLRRLNELASGVPLTKPEQPAAPVTPQQAAAPVVPVTNAQGVIPFVASDEDLDWSAESVNKLLTQTYAKAVETTFQNIPILVQQVVARQLEVTRATEAFFESNPDLKVVTPFVQKVGAELERAHPDWAPAKLFEELAKTVRDSLKLTQAGRRTPNTRPALAARPSTAAPNEGKPKSKEQQEMGELLEFSQKNYFIR